MKVCTHKEYLRNVLPGVLGAALCGIVTGVAIFGFKVGASFVERLSRRLYAAASQAWWGVVSVFAVLAVAAVIMWLIHKWAPESRGGGIPRSEGVLRGRLRMRRVRTLLATLLGSYISFFCGLPLGSEGPSVLIGTALGGCIAGNRSATGRYVMTSGAGAGFAVATGAPFSGILFALEEIHKRFTPMLVLSVSVSVLAATYSNGLLCTLFGVDPRFLVIDRVGGFSLSDVGWLVALGLLTALGVAAFDIASAAFGRLTKRYGRLFSPNIKLLAMFLVTGVVVLLCADGAYSGHHVIAEVAEGHKTLWAVALLLVVRFVMMLLVTDSGATGGIFISTLAIGSLVGALASRGLIALGMSESLYSAAVLLGMCAFIGGTLRAPLTATVLYLELTGQFTNLFFVAVVVFSVNAVTELLNRTPFYERSLEEMEHTQNGGLKPSIAHFEMCVSQGAFVVGKAIRDVMWPSSSVVISITRAHEHHEDMDNDGEKKLYVGDTLIVRARYYDEEELRRLLQGLVGTDHAITKIEQST